MCVCVCVCLYVYACETIFETRSSQYYMNFPNNWTNNDIIVWLLD